MSELRRTGIDGNTFAVALQSGIYRVIGQQDYLNRINVFPIADSDTGTNLNLSLSAALPFLAGDNEKPLGQLLIATADVLLDNARGNSGAIFAQFFQGLSDSVGDSTELTPESFAAAAVVGSEYARAALSRPREGTILSAISAFAEALSRQVATSPHAEFSAQLHLASQAAHAAVEKTQTQLDVLKKAGVVDAGAKGFAELLGGFSDYLSTGEQSTKPELTVLDELPPALEISATDNALQYRYCTECLVTDANIDRRKLREALNSLGDSVVLAGTKRKAKIHIHADDPEAVFELARQFGELSGTKADDMHRQHSSMQSRSRSFAVITDSGADIADVDLERLDIHMVPCRIQFGDHSYMDKVSISADEFYTELQNNPQHPTTSRPAPGDFRRQFQFLASHYNDVVSINLTSAASGTYEGARAAAASSDAHGRIHVVDSLNASVGQGQLVVMAAECAALGHSVEDTLRILRERIPKTKTFAIMHDLEYASRGGRLPRWIKLMADLMRVTPVICIKSSGQIGVGGGWFGRSRRIEHFAKFIAGYYSDETSVQISVGHASCPDDATRLAAEIQRRIPHPKDATICDMGTAIGVHGGPGTLIVSTRPFDLLDIATGENRAN
jgi:DegV family protein with EDD domain